MVRASGSYPLCQGFKSLHRHLFLWIHFLAAFLAGAAPACGGDSVSGDSPEEEVELARAKADAADILRRRLVDAESSLSVRLRAIRGLVEGGRVDQLRLWLLE